MPCAINTVSWQDTTSCVLGTVTLRKAQKDGKSHKKNPTHKQFMAILLDHSFCETLLPKTTLISLDLLYRQSNMTKKSPCSYLRALDNMANGVPELYFHLKITSAAPTPANNPFENTNNSKHYGIQ